MMGNRIFTLCFAALVLAVNFLASSSPSAPNKKAAKGCLFGTSVDNGFPQSKTAVYRRRAHNFPKLFLRYPAVGFLK
jgi:hypothetical protein